MSLEFSKFVRFGALIVLMPLSSAHADKLRCIPNGDGWSLKNETKNFVFASSAFYYSKRVCETAKATQRDSGAGYEIVCAPNPQGTSVYTVSGELIGRNAFYYEVATCKTALDHMKAAVVCLPSANGSVLADLRNGFFVGETAYYHSVKSCAWASFSASEDDNYVCGPKGGGTSLFDRGTRRIVNNVRYAAAEDCYKELRGQIQ